MFAEFAGYLSIAGGLLIVFSKFFSEKLIGSYFDKKLESYKSELSKLNSYYQIQFNALHIERAEIIKKLYQILIDYQYVVGEFFNINLDKDNPKMHLRSIFVRWDNSIVDFNQLFHRNKIFFSKDHVELMNTLSEKMGILGKRVQHFNNSKSLENQILAIKTNSTEFEELKSNNEIIRKNMEIIQADLENEFRMLLGVE
jgi:hypothetical protein